MASPVASPPTVTILSLLHKCLHSYGKLLLTLKKDVLQSWALQHEYVLKAKEEYGRLHVWGEQSKAVLPSKARYSLDEELRQDEGARSSIVDSLGRLLCQIERGVNTQAEALCVSNPERVHSSQNDDSDQSSSSSSSYESDSIQTNHRDLSRPKIHGTLRRISQEIRSLYRISALLRRPRVNDKYLRSRNKRLPSYSLSASVDFAHISEKIRQWRGVRMRQPVGEDDEQVVTERDMELRKGNPEDELSDIIFLCLRLSRANMLRREQMNYWERFPDVPEPDGIQYADPSALLGPPGDVKVESQKDLANAFIPPEVAGRRQENAPSSSRSVISTITRQTFSSVAFSALDEANTEIGRARTVYTASVSGQSGAIRVPEVTKYSAGHLSFDCPFCHTELEAERMQDRAIWKRHVFRDLRPYVCTFQECQNQERLFVTHHDWIYHEQQMHRRKWVCPEGCVQGSVSKPDMMVHLQYDHPSDLNLRQISIMADMCEREIDGTEQSACPLCLVLMTLSQLQRHLATHMEELALFVLPIEADDVTNEGDFLRTPPIDERDPEEIPWKLAPMGHEPVQAPEEEMEAHYLAKEKTSPAEYARSRTTHKTGGNSHAETSTDQATGTSKANAVEASKPVSSPAPSEGTISEGVARRDRKNSTDLDTREHADVMRKLGVCWICAFQRDKCDPGEPCGRCAFRSQRGQQHLLKCVRIHLQELTFKLLPPVLSKTYTEDAIVSLVRNSVHSWGSATKTEVSLSAGLGHFLCYLDEYQPSSLDVLHQRRRVRDSTGNWSVQNTWSPPLALQHTGSAQKEMLERHVAEIMDACHSGFQSRCFESEEAPTSLLKALFALFRRLPDGENDKSLKGDLRLVGEMLITTFLMEQPITIERDFRSEVLIQKYGDWMSPKLAERQLKHLLSSIRSQQYQKALNRLHQIMRAAADKSRRWMSSFVLMLGFALAGGKCQSMMYTDAATKAENEGSHWEARKECVQLDDAYDFLCKLYHCKYRGKHRQKTRFSEWSSVVSHPAEAAFVSDIEKLVDIHGSELVHVLREEPDADYSRSSLRFMARFLVELFGLDRDNPQPASPGKEGSAVEL